MLVSRSPEHNSDPEGTPQQAEVYRLAIIRRLVDHPDFGLKQLSKLTHEPQKISTVDQMKTMLAIWKDYENQLPCVVFTYSREAQPATVDVPDL